MSAVRHKRPVNARDFNRLLFALLLLGALTVFARLVTRQESQAAGTEAGPSSLAQWVQTADALFVRSEWAMAADAYYGALEAAARHNETIDPRIQKKLAMSLFASGEQRAAVHHLRIYHARLLRLGQDRHAPDLKLDDRLLEPAARAEEIAEIEEQLANWEAAS